MKSIMEEASTITKAIENAWNRAGQPQEFTVKILELPKTSFFGLKTAKSAKIALLFNEMIVKAKEPQKHVRPLAPRPPQDRRDQREPSLRQGPSSSSGLKASPGYPEEHPQDASRGTADKHPERSQHPQRRPLQPRDQQRDVSRDQQRDSQREPLRDQQRAERPQDGRQNARPDQRRPQQAPRPPVQRQPYRSDEQMPEEPRRIEPRTQTQERENWAPEMVEAAQDWVKETLVLMGKPDIKIIPQVSYNYLKLYLDQPVMDDYKQEETQLKSWGSLAMEAVREKANKPLRSLRIILESKK